MIDSRRKIGMACALVSLAAAAVAAAPGAKAGEANRDDGARVAVRRGEHWISAWGTAQQLAPTEMPDWAKPPKGVPPPPPSASPIPPIPERLNSRTVRMIVRTTIAGRGVRVLLSDAYGDRSVRIGAARVALRTHGSAIDRSSERRLTVGGRASFTLRPGAVIVSDPVTLDIPSPADLAVSLFVAGDSGPLTVHPLGLHTTYVAAGDVTAAEELTGARTNESYFWLTGVDVLAQSPAEVIVAFGDSITDGFRTTPNTNRDWPAVLAGRLRGADPARQWAVLNMGYSGNRVIRDGADVSALARFDRDVLSRIGARWIVYLEGINDIGFAALPGAPAEEQVTAGDLIAADRELIARAHLHGLQVMGATLTPYSGSPAYTAHGEAIRRAVNRWIRSGGAFDRVVDFDAATRDPADPERLRPSFDSGDHIHPNDAGNRAMAGAIDLASFTR
ncbi:MAG: SGNH/GDSL hydrolase family protein [Steroidobacteraceae bacterium]